MNRSRAARCAFLAICLMGGASLLSRCTAKVERQGLTLADFDFLEFGMSLKEITARVGWGRDVASGVYNFQYDLVDGRMVELFFGSPDRLLGARLREKDGSWTDLLEKQD
jgi:hypothetical protein